jgi:dihydrofolate reductase
MPRTPARRQRRRAEALPRLRHGSGEAAPERFARRRRPRTKDAALARRTRRVRYQVAASLDGYIAGPGGEADWIPNDPDVDFAALWAQFDTLLIGRRTFEMMAKAGGIGKKGVFGKKTYVFSRTLKPNEYPGVTMIADRLAETIADLQAAPGKDIWLFGGGDLFRSLAALGLVDRVEVALVPAMLGQGLPLLPAPGPRLGLELTGHRIYEKTGIVVLEYAVKR